MDDVLNQSGVALVLTLARYFKSALRLVPLSELLAEHLQDGRFGQKTSSS